MPAGICGIILQRKRDRERVPAEEIFAGIFQKGDSVDIRYSANPEDVKRYTTEELRKEFMITDLYRPGV